MNKKSYIQNIIDNTTQSIFKNGCDLVNYEILKMTKLKPTTINILIEQFKLTKVPTNRRVNLLKEAGLVVRARKDATISITDLGKKFICIIEDAKDTLSEYLIKGK